MHAYIYANIETHINIDVHVRIYIYDVYVEVRV